MTGKGEEGLTVHKGLVDNTPFRRRFGQHPCIHQILEPLKGLQRRGLGEHQFVLIGVVNPSAEDLHVNVDSITGTRSVEDSPLNQTGLLGLFGQLCQNVGGHPLSR